MKKRIQIKFFLFLLLLFYPISLCAEEYIVHYPQLGIKMRWDKSAKAVIVDDVKKDSNVYKAGLRPGDAISMIGMAAPSSLLGVRYEILDLTPGEPGKLSYKRNGELKWAQFIIEMKEYKTFYNTNLTKHEFPRTDHKSMLNLGITRSGFSKYIQYTRNYLALLQKVETGEFDPKVAAYSAISGFYYLYDKSKKSKLDKDIYAVVNHRFYTIINSISAKISTDFKESKIKKSDGELVKFVDTIYEYYYMPNYAEFPDIQKQTANLNAMKKILAKVEADALKKAEEKAAALKRQEDLEKKQKQAELSANASNIENKYRSNTGGWQDLKWGMTVDEVRMILKNNGDELRDAGSNEHGIILNFQDSDSVLTKLVKQYYDNQGPLYFYSGKLMGRLVDISSSEYIDNHQFITKSLKEKYPDGKVFTKTGHGFGYGGVKYHHFFYKSQDLNVFTLNVPAGYGGGGVYYYDPVAIEKIKMNKTNKAKEIENKKKQKLKNKF